MTPTLLLLQTPGMDETKICLQAAMLVTPSPQLRHVALESLGTYANELREGLALPVGSVEFVRKAFTHAGIPEPANFSYHPDFQGFLKREVRQSTAWEVLASTAPVFVKPLTTKTFTGFVFQPGALRETLTEHDAEQWDVLKGLAPSTPLWTSEPEEFESEWRYYCIDKRIAAVARYDQNETEEVRPPDVTAVAKAAGSASFSTPFTLDFGVTTKGETKLIEANDFWAIGLYQRVLSPKDYLRWLSLRWESLLQTR